LSAGVQSVSWDGCALSGDRVSRGVYFCRMKAESKAAKKGLETPDYSKCDEKFADKWGKAETKAAGQCPTSGDESDIKTEVFVLPAACSYEKEGSISNSGRWAQWRYKAVEPPGEAMPDLEIMNILMLKLWYILNVSRK